MLPRGTVRAFVSCNDSLGRRCADGLRQKRMQGLICTLLDPNARRVAEPEHMRVPPEPPPLAFVADLTPRDHHGRTQEAEQRVAVQIESPRRDHEPRDAVLV